jgi:hypothetical protein
MLMNTQNSEISINTTNAPCKKSNRYLDGNMYILRFLLKITQNEENWKNWKSGPLEKLP